MGEVQICQHKDPRSKVKDECNGEFESKEVRDAVKAQALNLAKRREDAGMRQHLPNHLQKDFKALKGLSYDLKKKHPNLRRSHKFDEDSVGLFMDIQFKPEAPGNELCPSKPSKLCPSLR